MPQVRTDEMLLYGELIVGSVRVDVNETYDSFQSALQENPEYLPLHDGMEFILGIVWAEYSRSLELCEWERLSFKNDMHTGIYYIEKYVL